MKLKKYISKLLILSIALNNVYFISNAATSSSLSRYETLEGEIIDLEDTKSEDITEIEIFGNTVQDPNSLDNIQSVGELYVNEKGEPILDSQGKEQYEIDIESFNIIDYKRNLKYNDGFFLDNNGEMSVIDGFSVSDFIQIKSSKIIINNNTNTSARFVVYDANNIPKINQWIEKGSEMTYSTFYGGVKFRFHCKTSEIDLFEVKDTDIELQSSKSTVLLPCQLMKVSDSQDRLYWDNKKNRYVIEKNVEVFSINDLNIPNSPYVGQNNARMDLLIKENIGMHNTKDGVNKYVLAKNLKSVSYYVPDRDSVDCQYSFNNDAGGFWLGLVLPKEFNTNELFMNELKRLDVKFYMALKTPQIIETNITKKIELKTYPEKTYVSTVSNNEVKPTLKILVDRIEQVSQEAVKHAESNSTSSNISLARIFVNQLPDSIYKDQLQEKLNNLFGKDIVFEKYNATANLDVYIKSENLLSMSLDTNTVTFEEYSSLDELEIENAINISINSSLPYSLNAYVVSNITNNDKSKTMDLDVLNIRDSNQVDYKKFNSINSKLIILDNVNKGNNINHNIDLKLSGNKAYDADIYKTTIKFEAEQK